MNRPYPFSGCEAGIFHALSRGCGKLAIMQSAEARDMMVRIMRAYEVLLGVRVLTYCFMSNHFHILVQVPHRPDADAVGEGTGPDLDTILLRLEAAVGGKHMKLVRAQLEMWRQAGHTDLIEDWRQRQVGRMYSLQAFIGCVKQRFTRWYNATHEREGILWERRFTSVIVQDEARALRTMATYIDLNPVRAGLVSDPADYPWCGYAEAMRDMESSQQGLARVVNGGALDGDSARGSTKAGCLRAIVRYRHLLGLLGRERRGEDGRVIRRGVSEKLAVRFTDPATGGVRAEVNRRKIRHFTQGVIFGSRSYIDEWFTRNRDQLCNGTSRTSRKTGARSMGRAGLRGLYTLRSLTDAGLAAT